ncbi:MAG: Transcriptional regulator DauR [Chlamydiia bacterium]|nr:Transcriptional regulator DauR [Chlamydiia bacterium]
MREFDQLLKVYEPLLEAITQLFHPFVEVAVHDLEKGKIVAIYHNISQRKVGDASPLHELEVNTGEFPDIFPPYYKENWDGSPLKCSSITMRDKEGAPIGVICINTDVSTFKRLETFLKTQADALNPVEIYSSGSEKQIEGAIEEYLRGESLARDHLTRDQKRELVRHLYDKGVFNFKNAANTVAQKLQLSRASVYNYISGS